MDLPKYTTILHDVRVNLGLSMNEYAVADMIYKLSTNPKGSIQGWCYASKPYIGKVLGLSEQSIHTIIRSLTNAGLIEKDPDTKYLRATEKWYNAAVVSNFSHTKETLASADTETTKESLVPLKPEAKESLAKTTKESLANNNIQDIERDIITSPNGEEQQAANDVESEVMEGEVAAEPKDKTKTSARKGREPNPDGSYGDPEVCEVRAYFLERQSISGEDCTRNESGRYWNNLLRYMETEAPGIGRVAALKKFIDCLVSGLYIEPSGITSPVRLFYRRQELMKKIREKKTRGSITTYDNVVGGVAY